MEAAKKLRTWIIALVTLLLLAAPAAGEPCYTALVTAAHDGDTFTVGWPGFDAVVIRLNRIDTPELAAHDRKGRIRWPDQPWGQEAARALRDLALAERVVVCPQFKSYGRLGATVYLRGRDLAEPLAAAGLGWVGCRKGCPETRAAADRARQEGRGLWADPHPVRPKDWRKGKRE